MTRKLTKYAVAVLAILLAKLIYAYAHSFLHHYTDGRFPYKSTAISMLAIVLIFYPVFHFLDKYFKSTTKAYVQGAKKVTSNSFWGLFIGFFVAVVLLFAGFLNIWYNRNMIQDIGSWFSSIF